MSGKLKNIEDNVKGAIVLYTKETNVVNPETGEYVPIKSTQVVKEHTRTSFIQLYTQNIDFLISKDLTDMERRALLYSFNEMNYYNIIRIDSGLRKRLEVASKLSQGSVSKAIKGLIDKGVFLKINIDQAKEFNIEAFTSKEYVINANLVGRGSFKEMKNMRQTVVTNFDFETLTGHLEASTWQMEKMATEISFALPAEAPDGIWLRLVAVSFFANTNGEWVPILPKERGLVVV